MQDKQKDKQIEAEVNNFFTKKNAIEKEPATVDKRDLLVKQVRMRLKLKTLGKRMFLEDFNAQQALNDI